MIRLSDSSRYTCWMLFIFILVLPFPVLSQNNWQWQQQQAQIRQQQQQMQQQQIRQQQQDEMRRQQQAAIRQQQQDQMRQQMRQQQQEQMRAQMRQQQQDQLRAEQKQQAQNTLRDQQRKQQQATIAEQKRQSLANETKMAKEQDRRQLERAKQDAQAGRVPSSRVSQSIANKANDRVKYSNGEAQLTRPLTAAEMKKGFTGKFTTDGRALVKFQGRTFAIPAARAGLKPPATSTSQPALEAGNNKNVKVDSPQVQARIDAAQASRSQLTQGNENSTDVAKFGDNGDAARMGRWADKGVDLARQADNIPVQNVAKEIPISRAKYGEAADHIADAQNAAHPDILTIARDAASTNRDASIGGIPKVNGKQLDEYPPAMFKEGGTGASVRPISPRDNMAAGACIGNACRGLANGDKVRIKVTD